MNIRNLLLSTAFLLALATQAQEPNPFMNDANGRPLYRQTSYRSEGSPYFHDLYSLAEITSVTGKVYPNVNVKVNVQTNEVLYMAEDGTEMIATMPVKSIRFINFMSGQGAADRVLESFGQPLNSAGAPVYEVLASGHVSLLKQIKINYTDNKEFNQASIVRNFKRKETWHLRMPDGTISKFETGKESLLTALKDKQKEVAAYIDKEALKCRNIEDCRKVIAWYNSLF